jgi:hypothetical protein
MIDQIQRHDPLNSAWRNFRTVQFRYNASKEGLISLLGGNLEMVI